MQLFLFILNSFLVWIINVGLSHINAINSFNPRYDECWMTLDGRNVLVRWLYEKKCTWMTKDFAGQKLEILICQPLPTRGYELRVECCSHLWPWNFVRNVKWLPSNLTKCIVPENGCTGMGLLVTVNYCHHWQRWCANLKNMADGSILGILNIINEIKW